MHKTSGAEPSQNLTRFPSRLPLQACEDPDAGDGVAVHGSPELLLLSPGYERPRWLGTCRIWLCCGLGARLRSVGFAAMARSLRGAEPAACALPPEIRCLSCPRPCKELLLDLLSQKLCNGQCFVLQPQKSDYSLDYLLSRALPPCFGCFNGLLVNLTHSPRGGNLPFLLK